MSVETKVCSCGKGTITYRMEMDDWNRVRDFKTINCPVCKAAADKQAESAFLREQLKEKLLADARSIAEKRYLNRWLGMFRNKSKKEAWLLYTGGSGYPALGTFYKHVKEADGVEPYLRNHFGYDFSKALRALKIKDLEIENLLSDARKLG
jgi:hypothetical protein